VRGADDIDALAAAMDRAPALVAVGVVSEDGSPSGLVLRRELFDLLGKPYGREFYKKKPVSAVMKTCRVFHDDESIFGVAETLKAEVRKLDDSYYLLVNTQGRFSGVFSTKNVLIYLSDTTARDIALAQRLQSAIVRDSFQFEDPRCTILCSSKMAKEVGGDFYVVKKLDADRLIMGICDVSGKGIAASLITAVLGGIFDTYTAAHSLQPFLRSLNRYIFETFRLEYFVTGIFIELDVGTGQALICDMGHSYVLVQEEKMLFRLGKKTANPPLGIVQDLTPALSNYRFRHGGLALLFTDGVVEQTDRQGAEYSQGRLWGLLKKHAARSPSELKEILSADFDAFRGTQPQSDDVTFMILKYA
jgi:sigma-B regulation protein RsbU (phosphoserine phosphatase)